MRMPRKFTLILIPLLLAGALGALLWQPKNTNGKTVVVYCSVDDVFALPVFEAFTKSTGIKVVYSFDSESTKTTGLAIRLEQMSGRPDADVFWNSEQSFTQ